MLYFSAVNTLSTFLARSRCRAFYTFLSAALVIGLLCGCGSQPSKIGEMPSLDLKNYQGESIKIDGKSGDVILLVFWATWCGPCLMKIPALVKLQETYKGKKFRVISINVDDADGDKALPIMKSYGVNYPVLIGSESVMEKFGGIQALPTSFIIGADGIVKEKIQGLLPESELESRILAFL